ncbi:hypothetical protein ASG88_21930 [Nocardioides sp. Soil777]|uniref:DUF2784 domain-containing protein n=1 Tax=Nocardioides sp. Soil777 TaxID=1736409 RepID=UPI0007024119|nr:DUF2784 domain-containing protein [Nocardioides sp. Soil777]KRF04100.1 hypothetical protein ASG88_21930 [Nocardioides sp. Soil777]
MAWTLMAWAVVILHLAFLVFQMLGALLARKSRVWFVLHLAVVTWGVGIVITQGSCPLTVLEKDLIERAGGTPYAGSFLDHYIFGILLPDGTQTFVYATHLVVILATYAYVVWRLRRRSVQGAGDRAATASGSSPGAEPG